MHKCPYIITTFYQPFCQVAANKTSCTCYKYLHNYVPPRCTCIYTGCRHKQLGHSACILSFPLFSSTHKPLTYQAVCHPAGLLQCKACAAWYVYYIPPVIFRFLYHVCTASLVWLLFMYQPPYRACLYAPAF